MAKLFVWNLLLSRLDRIRGMVTSSLSLPGLGSRKSAEGNLSVVNIQLGRVEVYHTETLSVTCEIWNKKCYNLSEESLF